MAFSGPIRRSTTPPHCSRPLIYWNNSPFYLTDGGGVCLPGRRGAIFPDGCLTCVLLTRAIRTWMKIQDKKRRRLLIATTAVGGAGVVLASVPFIASMAPSARARALGSPVEVDFSKLRPGQMLTVEWRGQPVWIVRRTPEMVARLEKITDILVDPDSDVETQQPPYAKNLYRSIKPEIMVVIGICTHLGCVPTEHFPVGVASGVSGDWPGGYFCHCHGSKFDLAGRVFKNVPAPTNLVVPAYTFLSDTKVLIGVDPDTAGQVNTA